MSDINVVNPGLVNVADQADGLVSVNQTISSTSPSTNSGPTSQGLTYADGLVSVDQTKSVGPSTNSGPTSQGLEYADGLVSVEQAVTISPPMTAQQTVEGGTASPTSPNVTSTTENTVVGQASSVQQYNQTTNVFV